VDRPDGGTAAMFRGRSLTGPAGAGSHPFLRRTGPTPIREADEPRRSRRGLSGTDGGRRPSGEGAAATSSVDQLMMWFGGTSWAGPQAEAGSFL
jgi:hypothetical protein